MTKPGWGTKRICPACLARYYDMHSDPPVCPTCGARYDPEALLKTHRVRPMPAEKAPAKVPLAVREKLGVDVDQGPGPGRGCLGDRRHRPRAVRRVRGRRPGARPRRPGARFGACRGAGAGADR